MMSSYKIAIAEPQTCICNFWLSKTLSLGIWGRSCGRNPPYGTLGVFWGTFFAPEGGAVQQVFATPKQTLSPVSIFGNPSIRTGWSQFGRHSVFGACLAPGFAGSFPPLSFPKAPPPGSTLCILAGSGSSPSMPTTPNTHRGGVPGWPRWTPSRRPSCPRCLRASRRRAARPTAALVFGRGPGLCSRMYRAGGGAGLQGVQICSVEFLVDHSTRGVPESQEGPSSLGPTPGGPQQAGKRE